MNLEVKGYIRRKSMLYKTGVEYGNYTMNHILGCAHGCNYPCYAFLMKKRFGQIHNYHDWIQPILVENTIELLEAELPKLKNKLQSVHLCFTTDPFMYGYNEIIRLSLEAIRIINSYGIKCTVLTKGLLPIELDSLSKENEYGISLVSLNEEFRKKMEPYSSSFSERISSLRKLHDSGFKTWISMEPYPTPNIINQELLDILNKISFVDKIIFGRLNYNSNVSRFKNYKLFYNQKVEEVKRFCQEKHIMYHIKDKTVALNKHIPLTTSLRIQSVPEQPAA